MYASIRNERPLVQTLWFGLGLLSVLATILFTYLWLIRSGGITFNLPFFALLSSLGWFAYGLWPTATPDA